MPNVLITTRCNRACKYCFAQDKVTLGGRRAASQEMSLENVLVVADWLTRSAINDFRLIGGEPTIHSRFVDIVDLVRDRGFRVTVFSNGVMPASARDRLASLPEEAGGALININHPSEYSPAEWQSLEKTLQALGPRAGLGFNVYRVDFDARFLVDLTLAYGLRREIRIGLAQPILKAENVFLPRDRYRAVGARLVELGRFAEARDVILGFDCGMTMCMFTDDQWGDLVRTTNHQWFNCSPILDIGPDLTVWPCFPLSGCFDRRLGDFATVQDLVEHYKKVVERFRVLGGQVECVTCRHLRRRQCFGGCLAHAIRTSQAAGGDLLAAIHRAPDGATK